MLCHDLTKDLDSLLDDELDAERARAAWAHVEECAECAARVATQRNVLDALATDPVEGPSDGFFERALAVAVKPSSRRTIGPRLVAAGFVSAFAASILTVVLTGLWVRSPDARRPAEPLLVSLALQEPRVVNLVFVSAQALDDVELTVELPEGIELADYPGRRDVAWHTELVPGNNVLPLTLKAFAGRGGPVVARLQQGEKRKIFIINVNVG
jgi:anti-sigma factor RsiW